MILFCCTHAEMIDKSNRLLSLVIKKYSHAQPLILNIKSENKLVPGAVIHKQSANQPPFKTNLSKRFSRSICGPGLKLPLVPYILPLIPKTPVLPLFPHWLPPPPTSSPFILKSGPVSKLAHLFGWSKRNIDLQKKLLEMKHKGALTPEKYLRLQNLLLRI